MSRIRSKNTRPELVIRSGLHKKGFRFRIHHPRLPGKPDLVFPKYKAAIFVHGCFWHGHNCPLFKWPSTRADFWKSKINRNREKDRENHEALRMSGWRILTIWECALDGRYRYPHEDVLSSAQAWLLSDMDESELRGRGNGACCYSF